MNATATPLHDLAHAKGVIADNPGIPLIDLLKHPNKKWTPDARAFLENDGKDAPQVTPPNGHSAKEEVAPAEAIVAEQPVNPILQAALRCVEKGWYVFALEERGKRPDGEFAPHGFNSSTNDANAVRAIFTKKPNANYGIDLGRSNLTVLDFDAGMPNGLQLPNTLQVSTSRGVHVYFQGVSKQADMYVGGKHVGEIKSAGGYVLGPYCVHPDGPVYTPITTAPLAPVPSLESFRATDGKAKVTPRNERGLVPHGSIHGYLLTQAGKLRNQGLGEEAIRVALYDLVEKNCEPPIDWKRVDAMAKSICIYEEGQPGYEIPLTQKQGQAATTQAVAVPTEPQAWGEVLPLKSVLRPVLPFLPEYLPRAIRPWCKDVAERMGVPLDFAGIAALETIAGVIGRRAFVYPKAHDKEWKESIAISGGVVSSSGTKKTPAWKLFTNVVVELEMDLKKGHEQKVKQYEAAVKKLEQARKAAEKRGSIPSAETIALANQGDPQDPGKPPRLVLNDVTPEKAHITMSENSYGLLYYRDELASWAAELDKEREIARAQAKNDPKNANKPDQVIDKIVEGRLNKFYEENVLLDQPFVKDPAKTMAELVDEKVAKTGEKITIRRFMRYKMGEGLQRRDDDFGSEVASLVS